MTLNEKADISKSIIELAVKAYPRLFVSCSFGKDSRVLVDLAQQVKKDIPMIAIDTGYEFQETMDHGKELTEELGLNLRWVSPSEEERQRIDEEYGDSFIKNDQYKCCEMKIPAINSILGDYDAWVTGLRRDETEYRKNTPVVESGRIIKVNPLVLWTKDDIWRYINDNNLKYHPLYDQGYASLGCKPCTTEGKMRSGGGRQGQFERAGRFTGANAGGECGLHTQ